MTEKEQIKQKRKEMQRLQQEINEIKGSIKEQVKRKRKKIQRLQREIRDIVVVTYLGDGMCTLVKTAKLTRVHETTVKRYLRSFSRECKEMQEVMCL